MHLLMGLMIPVFLVLMGSMSPARADNFVLGISAGDEGLRSFHLSVGDYYRVPPREIVLVRDRIQDEDELPVVFFIAKHAHVKPGTVIRMRERGRSWMEISRYYGIHLEIYYYTVTHRPYAGPYGRAYGHFNHDRQLGEYALLDDRDIINLVNLRYMSELHGCRPERIMQMRSEGKRFPEIHQELRTSRTELREKERLADASNRGPEKSGGTCENGKPTNGNGLRRGNRDR